MRFSQKKSLGLPHESRRVINVNPVPRLLKRHHFVIGEMLFYNRNILLFDIIRLTSSNEKRGAVVHAFVFKSTAYFGYISAIFLLIAFRYGFHWNPRSWLYDRFFIKNSSRRFS